MPLHDLECAGCGKREERWIASTCIEERCKDCGALLHVVYDWGKSAHGFKPYWEENLGDKPVYIESNAQLARECRERGLWAKRLDGGYTSY